MRYYVAADVHGFYTKLRRKLTEAGFFSDPLPHKLLLLGDVMDRGQEACEMQSFLLELMERDAVILVRGNHEDLFEELVTIDEGLPVRHHESNGTYGTALQLTGFDPVTARERNLDFAAAAQETAYYRRIIPATVDYYETEHYIFVHGWIPAVRTEEGYVYDPAWRGAGREAWRRARWYHGIDAAQQCDTGKTVLCGHWHCSYGHTVYEGKGSEFGHDADFSPYYGPGVIALDACTAYSGQMNLLVIEDTELEEPKIKRKEENTMRPVEQKDLMNYRFLSNVRYAPGGARAAFVVANADEEDNSYERRLWLYENGTVRQLTDMGKEGGFVWLDEQRLLFPAVRTTKEKKRAEAKETFTSYYVLDLRGGEALHAFTLPFAVEQLRVLDERHFAVTAAVDKKHPDLYAADEKVRADVRKEAEENKDYEVFDELPFWFNGAGVTNGQRTRLFLVNIDPLEIKPVTELPEDVQGMTVLGDEVIYAAAPRQAKLALKGFTLHAVNWRSGARRTVLHRDELMFEGMECVGGELWLLASEGRRFGLNENPWVYRVDPASGELSVLREEEYNMYNSVGSDCRLGGGRQAAEDGGALYHLTTREGDCLLHRLNADGSDTPVITKSGSIDAFDACGDEALLIALYDMRLQELYRADLRTGEITRVSDFNTAALADCYVAQPEPLQITSCGTQIGGWVLKPKDFDPQKTYPAVFDIHGGPKTVYGPVFYHEMQLWAGMGYFVFFCNPTGSDGRDNEFADIRGKYGTVDYQNLMDFMDAVLAAYPQIDKTRVCETGGSYGGFMTNWIIGHTDRFCCAASQRSISNWLSFYGTSDIGFYFAADQNDAGLYETPEKLWERSPLKYAKNAVTPTLFIHSDEDYRCPLEQGIQMYASLLDRGVEARMCLFHGENHELSRSGKPKHRLRRLQEITDWFERFANAK